ncbi:CASP-like protein 4B1 [Linum grandiflorum]
MSNFDDTPPNSHQKDDESHPSPPILPPPPGAGIAAHPNPTFGPPPDVEAGFGVGGIMRRWRRENRLTKASVIVRGAGFVFSLLAFVIMASNQHGDWMTFSRYEEYRYLVGVTILTTLYAGAQAFRQLHELYSGRYSIPLPRRTSAIVDFCGDQVASYMLMSAASSAIPMTNRMREGADNLFTDTSAAAISMTMLAFIGLAVSSIISAHKFFTQAYI